MPCYHPNYIYFDGKYNESGSKHYFFAGRYRWDFDQVADDPFTCLVPCKRCIGCRIDYSRQWADRMTLELDHSRVAIFVTLTYRDADVPRVYNDTDGSEHLSLWPKHTQDFFKRLRYFYPDKEIRYYLAGEYGSQTSRPHYHAIIFGLSLSDFPDLELYKYNEINQPIFISKKFEDIWSLGFCSITSVSWRTCAYVSRYVLKKRYRGDDDYYTDIGVMPEFNRESNRPGLGMYYPLEHNLEFNTVTVFDGSESKQITLPLKVYDKLRLLDPDAYAKLKADRRRFAVNRTKLELMNTDLSYLEYLNLKESQLYQRLSKLKERL